MLADLLQVINDDSLSSQGFRNDWQAMMKADRIIEGYNARYSQNQKDNDKIVEKVRNTTNIVELSVIWRHNIDKLLGMLQDSIEGLDQIHVLAGGTYVSKKPQQLFTECSKAFSQGAEKMISAIRDCLPTLRMLDQHSGRDHTSEYDEELRKLRENYGKLTWKEVADESQADDGSE